MTQHGDSTGKRLALAIDGMSCGHCKARVEQALGAMSGVRAIEVNVAEAAARLSYDPARATATAIAAAVSDSGYPARVVEG